MAFKNPATATAYLAAMIDGEGTVSKPTSKTRCVRITNTDRSLICACIACCNTLNIPYRESFYYSEIMKVKGWKAKWDLVIGTREGITTILKRLPIQSLKKLERLRLIVSTYKQVRQPSRPRLVELYQQKRWSLSKIAQNLKVSIGTVHRWMSVYNIPRRSDSQAIHLHWKKRHALCK